MAPAPQRVKEKATGVATGGRMPQYSAGGAASTVPR